MDVRVRPVRHFPMVNGGKSGISGKSSKENRDIAETEDKRDSRAINQSITVRHFHIQIV